MSVFISRSISPQTLPAASTCAQKDVVPLTGDAISIYEKVCILSISEVFDVYDNDVCVQAAVDVSRDANASVPPLPPR